MTDSVAGRNPISRYSTIDDELSDPRNHDLQERMSAKFQADINIVVAQIKASHGPDSDLLKMLGLDE